MDRESRITRLLFQASLLSFVKLFSPDGYNLLKLGSDKVAERSILSVTLLIDPVS